MAAVVLFDREGTWQDTLVCERRVADALRAAGGRVERSDDADVAEVFYLRRDEGWVGVLCDAGETLIVPAALTADGVTAVAAGVLPAQEEFITRLLALLGDEADDDAG